MGAIRLTAKAKCHRNKEWSGTSQQERRRRKHFTYLCVWMRDMFVAATHPCSAEEEQDDFNEEIHSVV